MLDAGVDPEPLPVMERLSTAVSLHLWNPPDLVAIVRIISTDSKGIQFVVSGFAHSRSNLYVPVDTTRWICPKSAPARTRLACLYPPPKRFV